jgi:hypothetical protein
MISVKKNKNFPSWIQVFAFGQFIDEVQGRAKALKFASRLAKKEGQTHINAFGEVKKVEENA